MKWLSSDWKMNELDMIISLPLLNNLSKEKNTILKNFCSSLMMQIMQKKLQKVSFESLKNRSKQDKSFKTTKQRRNHSLFRIELKCILNFRSRKKRSQRKSNKISRKNKTIYKWNLSMSRWNLKQNNNDRNLNYKTTITRWDELKMQLGFQMSMKLFRSFKHKATLFLTLKNFNKKMKENKRSYSKKSLTSKLSFKRSSLSHLKEWRENKLMKLRKILQTLNWNLNETKCNLNESTKC